MEIDPNMDPIKNASISDTSNSQNTVTHDRRSFKTVTDKLSTFLKRFSRDTLVETAKDPKHSADPTSTLSANINNSTNMPNQITNPTQKQAKTDLKFTKLSQDIDEEFMTSVLLGPRTKQDAAISQLGPSTKQLDDQTNPLSLNLPFQFIAFNIDPKHLLQIIQTRLDSHKTEYGNRVRCVPSIRTVNCQHHCAALLACRLFAILCNEQIFQHKLIFDTSEACFNMIVDILNVNNDPVYVVVYRPYLVISIHFAFCLSSICCV